MRKRFSEESGEKSGDTSLKNSPPAPQTSPQGTGETKPETKPKTKPSPPPKGFDKFGARLPETPPEGRDQYGMRISPESSSATKKKTAKKKTAKKKTAKKKTPFPPIGDAGQAGQAGDADAPPPLDMRAPPGAHRDPRRAALGAIEQANEYVRAAAESDPRCSHWQAWDPDAMSGASVPRSAWRPLIAAPVRGIEMWVDGRRIDLLEPVSGKAIDDCARAWEDASQAFGLSAGAASLVGAIGLTAATLGAAVVKAVARLVQGPRERAADPVDDSS